MNLSGNDKNKITGKKYQPVMSITGLNDQGHRYKVAHRIVGSLGKALYVVCTCIYETQYVLNKILGVFITFTCYYKKYFTWEMQNNLL